MALHTPPHDQPYGGGCLHVTGFSFCSWAWTEELGFSVRMCWQHAPHYLYPANLKQRSEPHESSVDQAKDSSSMYRSLFGTQVQTARSHLQPLDLSLVSGGMVAKYQLFIAVRMYPL